MIRTTHVTIEIEWNERDCIHPILWDWPRIVGLELVKVVDARDADTPKHEHEELGGGG